MNKVEFRILDYNYIFQSNVSITATSEQASFPVKNTTNYIRANTWRSNGYFEITSSNNKINFKETAGGAELTATIASGGYSISTLCAEIKAKLEAASANSRAYTVNYSYLTRKFTITGQVFLSLLFGSGTNASSSIAKTIGFAQSDYTSSLSYSSAHTVIHSYEAITIDLKSIEEIDSFCLFFDPINKINLTSSAVLRLQANATLNWSNPAVNVALEVDETRDVITYFFSEPKEFRFWRIYIEDPKNFDGFVEIGSIFLSKALQLSRAPDNAFEVEYIDQSNVVMNDYGHVYVDEFPVKRKMTFNYSVLNYEDIEKLEQLYLRVSSKRPIVVALDPLEKQFDKDQFVLYGYLDKSLVQTHIVTNFYKTNLKIVEAL